MYELQEIKLQSTGPRGRKKQRSLLRKNSVWLRRSFSRFLMRGFERRLPTICALFSNREKNRITAILHKGDILLCQDTGHLLAQICLALLGCRWQHAGVYIGGNSVIDIGTKPRVAEIELKKFLNVSGIAIIRMKNREREEINQVVNFLKNNLNKPFNYRFSETSDSTFYCTQLVAKALQQQEHPIYLEPCSVFGKHLFLSKSFEHNEQLELIFEIRRNFLRTCCSHIPLMSAIACGVLGATLCSLSLEFFVLFVFVFLVKLMHRAF